MITRGETGGKKGREEAQGARGAWKIRINLILVYF